MWPPVPTARPLEVSPLRVRFLAALLAALTVASASLAVTPDQASAAPKVAIIVGPTPITDSHYYPWAQDLADTARAAGATVDLRYCPTPAQAKAAVNGASIIVYFGHGTGFPNPYWPTELPDSVNGWGLRDPAKSWTSSAGCKDSVLRYYGQNYITGRTSGYGWTGGPITPAPNFTMVYSNACYAPGAGESRPAPAESVALQRVSNYSEPMLQLGGTYFATDLGSERLVDLLLRNQNERFSKIFQLGNGFSATALRRFDHLSVADAEAWIQRTNSTYLGDDYWYAFAGNPDKTPAGAVLPPTGPDMDRFAGADRYATAAAVSAASFAPGAPVAYIATGLDYPDALAAGAAASLEGGPVLLVSRRAIPPATANELARLKPGAIKVIGGGSVVSDDVLMQLAAYSATPPVRVAGANRYATAAAVSNDVFGAGVPVAYVATGQNFPDALSGVATAGRDGAPILLVGATSIPAETSAELMRLAPGRIVVLGGEGVVSSATATNLAAYATSGNVTRLAGGDRYATSVAISRGSFTAADTVFVATGTNFPDALGGGPVAGGTPGPLLLVPGTTLPSSVAGELARLDPARVVVLGSTAVVSSSVENQIRWLLSD